MACPYFYPSSPQAAVPEPRHAMLPLGDSWTGICHAIPDSPCQPDPANTRPLCNLGYARGRCDRFPVHAGPDAVRFTIHADTGRTVNLYYVLECDHHPFAHGPLEFVLDTASFSQSPATESLDRQARAYIASYLRRKGEANGG